VSRLDRRTFLIRGGGLIAAASAPSGWQFVGDALGGVDPRLRSLARAVKGPVITPASRSYGRARLVYNERFDAIHPRGIVQPISVEDVRRVVAWANKTRVRLAIRSGGHCYAGYSTTEGLVVDLRRLNAISLSPSGLATIGAGARMIDVEAALANRGRAIPAGSCATVGIGGLALGGGVGFASRKFGTTSDNIVSFGIVTADGRYRTCSASEKPNLYWACRGGGGGNFGIVTHFVFRTHAVAPVSYFFAGWPWAQAAEVVRAWQAFAPHAPDELFSICALQTDTGEPASRPSGNSWAQSGSFARC
jgi:FAD/FMN-containing dehydrogenase